LPLVAFPQHFPSVPHSLFQQPLPEEQLVPFEQSQLPLPQQVWFMRSHVRPVAQSVGEEQLVPSEQSPLPLPQQVPLLESHVRPVAQSVGNQQPCPSVHAGQPPPPQAWSESVLVAVSQHIPSVPHSLLEQSEPEEQLVPLAQS
jgi:hypothetical protein